MFCLSGSRRSGKSYKVITQLIYRVINNRKDYTLVCPTHEMARESQSLAFEILSNCNIRCLIRVNGLDIHIPEIGTLKFKSMNNYLPENRFKQKESEVFIDEGQYMLERILGVKILGMTVNADEILINQILE